ncbi:MAG: hypothetical protein WAM42_07450 [Candidatus Nitrosopolaris sp.]
MIYHTLALAFPLGDLDIKKRMTHFFKRAIEDEIEQIPVAASTATYTKLSREEVESTTSRNGLQLSIETILNNINSLTIFPKQIFGYV